VPPSTDGFLVAGFKTQVAGSSYHLFPPPAQQVKIVNDPRRLAAAGNPLIMATPQPEQNRQHRMKTGSFTINLVHMTDFGKLIHKAPLRRGLSQRELAEEICSAAHISRLERGRCLPSPGLLLQLAERLEVNEEPVPLQLQSNMALAYIAAGNFEQADRLLTAILNAAGASDRDRVRALTNVGLSQRLQRRYPEAQKALQQAWTLASETGQGNLHAI